METSDSVGDRLRRHREQQQIALADIAERTKIKLSLLEALERDDLSSWPRGIFRRSYVKAYAQAIGLDPDTVVREILARHPEAEEEVHAALAAMHGLPAETTGGRPPIRLEYLISSAIGAIPSLRARPAPPSDARGSAVPAPGRDAAKRTREAEPFDGRSLDLDLDVDQAPPAASPHRDAPAAAMAHGAPAPMSVVAGPSAPAAQAAARQTDLATLARLCTLLARARDASDVPPVLADAATMLGAVGLTVWTLEADGGPLRPALGHGYSDELLARLPRVAPHSNNVIGAAFRTGESCHISGEAGATSALAVPLMTPAGCAGVLAIELQNGDEQQPWVRASASILAAQLATLVGRPSADRATTA